MNQLDIMAKLGLVATLFVVSMVCNGPTQEASITVSLEKTLVADMFGNHDGVATLDEVNAVDSYFAANAEAWCVTGIPTWEATHVSPAEFKSSFAGVATHPYPSEQDLRAAFQSVSVKIPFVGIAVLQQRSQLTLAQYFRSPGPGIAAAKWELITVQ
jgi:hypothetical protein